MRRSAFLRSATLVITIATSAPGDDAKVGGPGESCRARADCKAGLKCVQQACTAEPSEGSPGASSGWMRFKLGGVHPFVGLAWMGGPAFAGVTTGSGSAWAPRPEGAFLFGIRGGVFLGRTELALEISPMTYAYYARIPGPAFQLNASVGPFLELYDGDAVQVFYPIRLGVGVLAGNQTIPTPNNVFFESRFDLVGAAIKVGHLMIDLNLPSFRYAITTVNGATGQLFSWLIGGGVSYVF